MKNTYVSLSNKMYSVIAPFHNELDRVELLNYDLANELGINLDEITEQLLGNKNFDGLPLIAQAYAGHQYGHFTNLGDGRAVLIGETDDGKDIHLKGSGPTPYSRRGDGYATLNSTVREYIMSEAMYYLGVPTSRTLSVISTKDDVQREKRFRGGVMARVATSHIRVGTFEYAVRHLNKKEFTEFVDYVIDRHFKGLNYEEFLLEVVKRQAKLIAKWQSLGFIHGVMNTDNMLVNGETIDYGPCAFMDNYNENTVFSSIDRNGRYAFINQPRIGAWNLSRLAETMLYLLDDDQEKAIKVATGIIEKYLEIFNEEYLRLMSDKIGYDNEDMVRELLDLMQQHQLDYTNTFVKLTIGDDIPELDEWTSKWKPQRDLDRMKKANPVIIPRNHIVEKLIEEVVDGKFEMYEEYMRLFKNPYTYEDKFLKEYKKEVPVINGYKTYCGT